MVITQDLLIKQIADREGINVATVREIFKTAEDIIFDYLSSITPTENVIIRPLNGLLIDRSYIDKKNYSKGMFKDIDCPEHVNVKGNISKYYQKKVNGELFVQ